MVVYGMKSTMKQEKLQNNMEGRKMRKRALFLILTVVFMIQLFPLRLFAAGETETEPQGEELIIEDFSFDPYDWKDNTVLTKGTRRALKSASSEANTAYDKSKGYGGQLTSQQKMVYEFLVSLFIQKDGLSKEFFPVTEVSTEVNSEGQYGLSVDYTPKAWTFYASSREEISNDISRAYWAFVYDYPTAFWAGKLQYRLSMMPLSSGYILVSATLTIWENYQDARRQIPDYNAGVRSAVRSIYESVATSSNRYSYYRAIHDWVCDTLTYNYDAVNSDSYKYAYSSGSVFTGYPNVVCEGYSETFKVLCDQMRNIYNIRLYCAEIFGTSPQKGSHMWNYVQMNDSKWYAVDTTWDDQSELKHTYFLCGANSEGFNASFADEHTERKYLDAGASMTISFPKLSLNRYINQNVGTENITYFDDLSFNYQSTINGTQTYRGLSFDLNWLTKDSKAYNHDLAIASLAMSMATFENDSDNYANSAKDDYVKDLLGKIGFECEGPGYKNVNMGVEDEPEEGTIAMVMSRRIYQGETYYVISLRGGGYGGGGWAGDFNVGSTGRHVGFYKAALYAARQFITYLNDLGTPYDPGHTHVWITGFSRSAATANLLSERLRDNLFDGNKIHTYTFATPNNQDVSTAKHSSYANIFNIVNPIDLIPMVPLKDWNMDKHGTTLRLPYYQTVESTVLLNAFFNRFNQLSGTDYEARKKQEMLINNHIIPMIADCFSREQFNDYLQMPLMEMKMGRTDAFDFVFGDWTTTADILAMMKNRIMWPRLIVTLSAVITSRIKYLGSDDPYVKLLGKLLEIVKKAIFEVDKDIPNKQIIALVVNLCSNGPIESHLFMQHWPEVYMAWMSVIDGKELVQGGTFRRFVARCPVDVEIYDENNNLVGRTVSEEVTLTDEETGEVITYRISSVDEEVTTIDMMVVGDEKSVIIPDDLNYTVKIVVNDNYEDGDTMSYSVTDYVNGTPVKSISYDDVPLEEDAVFDGDIVTPDQDIEACVLSKVGDENSLTANIETFADVIQITYADGDEEGDTETYDVVVGDSYLLLDNMFAAPAGMEFDSWIIDGEEYQPGMVYLATEDVIVTAHWTEIRQSDEQMSGYLSSELIWNIDESGMLEICGNGAMPDFDGSDGAPWFPYRNQITSLIVAEGVTSIGDYAFAMCDNLVSVTISNTVNEIHDNVFKGCTSIESMTIPFIGASRTSIDEDGVFGTLFGLDEDGISQYTRSDGSYLYSKSFGIPESLQIVSVKDATQISFGAFHNCSSIEEIHLNEGIQSIGSYAFSGCSGLTQLEIPSTVTIVSEFVLSGCTSIESLTIPFIGKTADNEGDRYSVLGHLFGTDSEGVVQYFSKSGTSISGYAFAIPETLSEVTLTNANRIPFGAFSGCSMIRTIKFSDTVLSIGEYAFYACNGLKDVYYNGTEAEWQDLVSSGNPFTGSNPSVNIMSDSDKRIPGDVNDDGMVDGRDLIRLKQYFAGYSVTINEANADVNGSDSVDGRDAIRLCQFFAGYDVILI